jgi:hypothetical protein
MQIFFTRLVLGFLEYVNAAVSPTLQFKPHGRGSGSEADAARRSPPLRLMRCGRRAAVILVS